MTEFGIITFPGAWSDADCFHAVVDNLDAGARYVWHKDADLSGVDCVILFPTPVIPAKAGIQRVADETPALRSHDRIADNKSPLPSRERARVRARRAQARLCGRDARAPSAVLLGACEPP